jgi:hypothetical protein
MPIKEIVFEKVKQGELGYKVIQYPCKLSSFGENFKFKKYQKLILMMRLARAVRYLESKGVFNNKINIDNIFFESDPFILIPKLGLPECSGRSFDFYKNNSNKNDETHQKALHSLLVIFL